MGIQQTEPASLQDHCLRKLTLEEFISFQFMHISMQEISSISAYAEGRGLGKEQICAPY